MLLVGQLTMEVDMEAVVMVVVVEVEDMIVVMVVTEDTGMSRRKRRKRRIILPIIMATQSDTSEIIHTPSQPSTSIETKMLKTRRTPIIMRVRKKRPPNLK